MTNTTSIEFKIIVIIKKKIIILETQCTTYIDKLNNLVNQVPLRQV